VLDASAHDSVAGTPGGTAMILPFPLIKGKNRVAVLDMSQYENFFEDIDLLFPIQQRSSEGAYSNSLMDSAIDVVKVGSYDVSVVPNYDQFTRLQFDKFNLHPDVTKLLGQYYSKNYGFMVCILRPQATYHPFAYVHELRNNGEMFIPTRHYHGNTSEGSRFGTTMGHSVFGKFHDRTELEPDVMPYGDYDDDLGPDRSRDDDNLLMDDLHLKNNFYDTLMDGDEYISHQMRRTALGGGARNPNGIPGPAGSASSSHHRNKSTRVQTPSVPVNRSQRDVIDWDHEIYIVNRPTVEHDSMVSKPGVTMLKASPGRLNQVSNYINFKRMPLDIAFGEIDNMIRISINKLYSENHDLFV